MALFICHDQIIAAPASVNPFTGRQGVVWTSFVPVRVFEHTLISWCYKTPGSSCMFNPRFSHFSKEPWSS